MPASRLPAKDDSFLPSWVKQQSTLSWQNHLPSMRRNRGLTAAWW